MPTRSRDALDVQDRPSAGQPETVRRFPRFAVDRANPATVAYSGRLRPLRVILVLDNRDSFIFNLVQALLEVPAEVLCVRSDAVSWQEVRSLDPDAILVGPGPGEPAEAGCSEDVIRELSGDIPMLGVCLGHQAIATAFGGRVVRSAELVHGKTRAVQHDGRGVFAGAPSPIDMARYNSLTVDETCLPAELEVSARGPGGEIMGLRHRSRPLEGIQFHPESVLCIDSGGRSLLDHFAQPFRANAPLPEEYDPAWHGNP